MFLEDVGFGREGPLGSTEHVSDIEGIDIVSHAALEGVASCSDGSRGVEIGTICWLREFRKTVELLLTHEAKKFLPRSSRLAFAVFAKFVPQGPLASSSNSGSQKRRWCGSPGTSAPAGTDLSSPAPEEGGLAPKTMIPESPNLPSDTDANSLLSQRVEQADPHINRNGTTLEVLNDIPPMQQSITQKSGTGGSLAKAGTLPELKLVESIPHPAPCDGKPNMHASEWPTIEESLKICPPKTRGASRLKPRFRFEMYQPRKRLDGKSPKTEEITAFKGRVRKLDLNDDILQLVMDHSGNCFESQLLLVQRLELLKQAGVELCFWRHESEKRDKASKRTNAAVDHVYHCTVDGCISSLDSLQKACQHLTGLHWKLKLFKCTKCPKAWPFGRHATSHEKYDHSPPELSSLHRAIVPIQAFDPASAATV
ncbi:hypothetical protein FRC17_008183 [Serendipita sp. 399]|nr:hypothetical protein FRC17_008183 [Serendipita sp. 399]